MRVPITPWLFAFILITGSCGEAKFPTSAGGIVRIDPNLDLILPSDAKLEKLAGGFSFLEGPVWSPRGYLLFSDMRNHRIYRWVAPGNVSLFEAQTGFAAEDHTLHSFFLRKLLFHHRTGPNGLAFDKEARLTICEHGNRRVTRIEKDGTLTIVAERYQGKRLNSPNDLVFRADGMLYFTDPSFGLPDGDNDQEKELPYSGIFLVSDRGLELVGSELDGPNGLALSPDEKYLYVNGYHRQKALIMRYEVNVDGTLSNGTVFFSGSSVLEGQWFDGMKVDARGNLYVAAPAGIIIIDPSGKQLGTLQGPEEPSNLAWGDADGRTLYITAETGLYRIRISREDPED